MDWLTGIQNALNYIEDNLTGEIDYETMAGKACVSSFHFQKVFRILCGCSIGEYIRNRKLTLAASDILSGKDNMIDISMKYGYNTPESFTKAYKRFHGITPIDTRKHDAEVKSYSRMIMKMIMEGGSVMKYKIVQKDSFTMIGKGISIDMNDPPEKIVSDFWKESTENGVLQTLNNLAAPNQDFRHSLVGISDSSTFQNNKYTYYIAVPYDGKEIPKDYDVRKISAQTWVIFSYPCSNRTSDAVMDMIKKIFTEFFPTSAYQPLEKYQLEVYPSDSGNTTDYNGELWLAVKEK